MSRSSTQCITHPPSSQSSPQSYRQFTPKSLQSVLDQQLSANNIDSYQFYSTNKTPNRPNLPRAITDSPVNINYQQSMTNYPFPVAYSSFETLPKSTQKLRPTNIIAQYDSELFFDPISMNPIKYNTLAANNTTVFSPPGPLETLPVLNIPIVAVDPSSYLN